MDVKQLIKGYLQTTKVMQLATVSGAQPWICNVYFAADEGMRLYWLSWPTRRHSQEITKNPKVAVAIQVKTDQPVIGIQAEGTAELVTDKNEIKKIAEIYVQKHGAGYKFYENYEKGTNAHQMYKLTPKKYVLFDEVNFAKNDIKEILL